MLNALLPAGFFLVLGVAWRQLRPGGVSPDTLQAHLAALIYGIFLPLLVFFTLHDLPLNQAALRILLYVLAVTLIALGIAWFWLGRMKIAPKRKGALLIAAAFGNVLFLGLPLSKLLFADWTMRVALEYMLVANVLLLPTLGVILARQLAATAKTSLKKAASEVMGDYRVFVKEPVLWAALLGLLANLLELKFPAWMGSIEAMTLGLLLPLMLLSVGLALQWRAEWNKQLVEVLPVIALQLVLVPLLMWGMLSLFGSAGVKTSNALLFDSLMPATVFGFALCERHKFDSTSYALAFSASTLAALLTVPLWYAVLF